MNILSRERQQQHPQPTRNITPNLLRFKSTVCAIQNEENNNRVIKRIVRLTVVLHERANVASTYMRSEC
jgi:hypothetical protein